MSWDIFVQDIPEDVKSLDDIPDDFAPRPIGVRSDVIAMIMEVVPMAVFPDPSWGTIDGPDFSIEVDMGADDHVKSFAFHVRGGDASAGVIADILEHLRLRAFDPESYTGFFDPNSAVESLRYWRAYRDDVVAVFKCLI